VVSSPPFVQKDLSKNDALLIWAHVLCLARSKDHVMLQSGERMLEASKVLRQQQATEFGDLCEGGARLTWPLCIKESNFPISSSRGLESVRWTLLSSAGRTSGLVDAFKSSTGSTA